MRRPALPLALLAAAAGGGAELATPAPPVAWLNVSRNDSTPLPYVYLEWAAVCRGAWARVAIDHVRRVALQI